MKRIILLVVLGSFVLACSGCFGRGSGSGAAVGGIAGALLDRAHPWRGGIIGATLGAIAGATAAEISERGARESAESGKPVRYDTDNGRGRYEAEPLGVDENGCRRVRERLIEDGRVVRKRIVTYCEEGTPERKWKRHERDEE